MQINQNVDLKGYTSFHVGGRAERLIEMGEEDDLAATVKDHGGGPTFVLGYGTNCLISDKGLPGTVILNRTGRIEPLGSGRYKASSGANWDELIKAMMGDGLWGLEFTSGIPGGVGAAIAGNIAAYGHKVADRLAEATILDSHSGTVEIWQPDRFSFDYRTSSLQSANNAHLVVLDATFGLGSEPTGQLEYDSALKVAGEMGLKPDSLENRRRIIMETRRRAGSLLSDSSVGPWTAGSFFKNPLINETQVEKILSFEEQGISREQLLRQNVIHGGQQARVSAAHVLLAAGFKRGQTWGQVRLHPEHILKIENLGSATAQEVHDVVQHIIASVQQKLGVDLEPEVRFLGEF